MVNSCFKLSFTSYIMCISLSKLVLQESLIAEHGFQSFGPNLRNRVPFFTQVGGKGVVGGGGGGGVLNRVIHWEAF